MTSFVDLSVGPLSDARLQLFAISTANHLWSAWKEAPQSDSNWTPWSLFPSGVSPRQICAGSLSDKRLQLFLIDANGQLWSCWKATTDSNSAWTGWAPFAGTPSLAQIAAGKLSDGRLQLFGVQPDGGLVSCWKTTTDSNAPWTPWTAFPGTPSVVQVAVAPLTDGQLQLFAVQAGGALISCWKMTADPNAAWTAWTTFPGASSLTEVAAAPLSDGQIQLFAINSGGQLVTCWKATTDVNANWTAWAAFPGAPGAARKIAVAPLSDGRLQLWVVDGSDIVWSCWKSTTASDSAWTAWTKTGFELSLSFAMQPQTQSNWCWSAVATSVSSYFNPSSSWTQCSLANAQLGQTTCCQNGSTSACNQPWYLDRALSGTGNLDQWQGSTEPFGTAAQEIEAGRPLGVRIGWNGGGGHFVAITGYDANQMLTVRDPIYGTSYIPYATLATDYQGSGTWTDSYFTKAG